MPIRKVKGGYRWGSKGHVYPTRGGAERQARAAYAHGYRGDARERMRAALARRGGYQRNDAGQVVLPVNVPFADDVPLKGASCATCAYLGSRDNVPHCDNEFYQQVMGTDKLGNHPPCWCCCAWSSELR